MVYKWHPACRAGLKNIVTVVMDDAVLVADASQDAGCPMLLTIWRKLESHKPTNMPKITGHGVV